LLAKPLIVSEQLRFHAPHDALALLDEPVEIVIAADIELLETLEELSQIADDGEELGRRRWAWPDPAGRSPASCPAP